MPDVNFAVVDVRDVAEAHLKALTVPEAANKRFILTESTLAFKHVGKWLKKKYGVKYWVAHCPLPKFLMYAASFFDSEVVELYKFWGIRKTYDNTEAKAVFGIKFIDMKILILEMGDIFIK